ncbi:hypothetical protein X975_17667, partial [Stegodyphus mimosarum]
MLILLYHSVFYISNENRGTKISRGQMFPENRLKLQMNKYKTPASLHFPSAFLQE